MEMKGAADLKVTMHNDLVKSKSDLSINEIKLLRLIIMQNMKDDTDFSTYEVPITVLANQLSIETPSLYRDIKDICKHLMKEVVEIWDGHKNHKWKMFQWVSRCEYDNGIITIRLHDDLKPYLLELKGLYTQYILEDVLLFKSLYSVRIYELIQEELRGKPYFGDKVSSVYLSDELIRIATNTQEKYERYSSFKTRVIDAAVNEINQKSLQMYLRYEPVKRSRKVVGYNFYVSSHFNPNNKK